MKIAFAALLLAAAAAAHGQAVYRCGSEYSQKPCPEGRTVAAEAPTPSTAEASKAAAQAKRNAKLADQMEKERVAQEKKVAGPSMVVTGQKPAASEPAKPAKKKKSKDEAPFKAVAPAPAKK
jgi:hypothetical protein